MTLGVRGVMENNKNDWRTSWQAFYQEHKSLQIIIIYFDPMLIIHWITFLCENATDFLFKVFNS